MSMKIIPVHISQPPLQMVVVEVTTWCNLKCPGCNRTIDEAKGTWKNKHMSLEEFRKVVDNLPPAQQIVLHGVGEPTLNPDYLDFIRYARQSGKFVGIVCITNALARDLDYYKAMIAAGMNSFTVSVDSFTQSIVELTRTGTPAEKLRRRLRDFREHGLSFSVSMVASKINLDDIPLTLQALDEIGVDTVHLQPYIEFDDKPNALKPADVHHLIAAIDALQPQLKTTRVHCPLLHGVVDPTPMPLCSSPWREPAVTVDGYLTPCCVKLVAEPLGRMDLKQHSFDALQSSPEFGRFLNSYSDSSPDFCEGCFNNHRDQVVRPLVTVTMVTYNHAAFVREAVQSVLAQNYSPLEIIISDDASTDNTADIVDECLATYSGPHRVRFLRQPDNLGARGRNNFMAAYRQSQGQFIIWFCGDDVMRPDQVARMVEVWQKEQVSLVTVNAEYIDEQSLPLQRFFRDPAVLPNVSVDNLARDGANDCNFGAGMGFSRELIETFGFDEESPPPHLPPDTIFPFYAGLLSGAAMISEPLLRYRVHTGQTSTSLEHEAATDARRRLEIEHKQWAGHLEIADFLESKLAHMAARQPDRFATEVPRFAPLFAHQRSLMQTRLADVAAQLENTMSSSVTAPPLQAVFESTALACLRANQLAEAAEVCQSALQFYPEAAVFWYTLALIMQSAGELEAAAEMIGNALALAPDNEEYLAVQASLTTTPPLVTTTTSAPVETGMPDLDALTYAPAVTVYFIDVSDECNLRCVYCHQSTPGYQGKPMAPDVLETLQQMVLAHPPQTHAFLSSGGETTTLKGWQDVVNRFTAAKIPCAIISNFARLFDESEIAALAGLSEILVSIDTIDAEITKRIRKRSDIKTILFNMQQVRAYCVSNGLPSPRMVWNVVGHDLALLHAADLAAAAAIYRPDHVTIAQMKPIPGLDVSGVRYIEDLSSEEKKACADAVSKALSMLDQQGISHSVNEQLKADIGLIANEALHDVPAGMTRDCLMPWEMVLTHSDGSVKPCCNAEGVSIGQIVSGQDPFETVFNGPEMRAWRKSMLTGELTEACRICTSYPVTQPQQLVQRVRDKLQDK